MTSKHELKIAIAQIAPVWLNKSATIEKIESYMRQAGTAGAELVVFGEALLPGYPFWLSLTHGAEFNSQMQKELYAHYLRNAITIEDGELDGMCKLSEQCGMAAYSGVIERAQNRGGHSVYCSLVFINEKGEIKSVHRKLQPTYEERLVWAAGDGHGLRVHSLKEFTVGGLNCWENWMPLSRTALYAQGENLHVAVWPGCDRNTIDLTRYIAEESRSFVISVSGLMRVEDIPLDIPYRDEIIKYAPAMISNGGSCIAGPDGKFIIEPVIDKEELINVTININRVYEERQNFDVAGHYSRPDVTKLVLNRDRQALVEIAENN